MKPFIKISAKFMAIALLWAVLALTPAMADDVSDFSNGLTDSGATSGATAGADARDDLNAKVAKQAEAALAQPAKGGTVDASGGYALGAGDKIRLTVFGEEDLSGEFEVDGTGIVALPLIGQIQAGGKTPRALEQAITDKLSDGYLVNPRVSLEVMNFRPFFILGEVNKPGSYPYVNDMTVISAVALAGGYTPRAVTGRVQVKRANDPSRKEMELPEDAKIYPGDIVRVEERFF